MFPSSEPLFLYIAASLSLSLSLLLLLLPSQMVAPNIYARTGN